MVRGWIGVSIQSVTPEIAKSFGLKEARGALVGDVEQKGPAGKAGIRQGDIIVSFGGHQVKNANTLPRLVAETPVGRSVAVVLMRDGKEVHTNVKVAELTEEKAAAMSESPVQSLGMSVQSLTEQLRQQAGIAEKSGVVVTEVEPGGRAEEAGIQAGDVIQEVNRRPVKDLSDYNAALSNLKKGSTLLLLLKRGGKGLYASLEVP